MEPIRFFNRHTQSMETETVYGEGFLRWTYGSPLGAIALHTLVKRAFFSSWYGRRMSTPGSSSRIQPFIANYRLDPSEFAEPATAYRSFNEFFYRKLKPSARPIDRNPSVAVFPADGRHLGFPCASDIQGVFIKGQSFDLPSLLGDPALAERYANGPLILSRLCPVDYHRFHFPVAGTPSETRMIPGPLFSVSPIALRKKLSYLWTNRRTITRIKAGPFGTVILLEIGATCVGSIHQTFNHGQEVEKGMEKGFFAFGGSSTITLFEPNTITLSDDLVRQSSAQTELYARMGSPMATLIQPLVH